MKRFRILFMLAVLAVILKAFFYRTQEPPDEKKILESFFPAEARIEGKTGHPPHYKILNRFVAYNSIDIMPGIRGYGGPISVLVVLTEDGRIRNIRILSHNETKNYVHYLFSEEFLSSFIGKSIRDPFVPGRDIDIVSRATVSEKALCDIVRLSSRKVARDILNIEVGVEEVDRTLNFLSLKALIFLFWFVSGAGLYFLSKRNKSLLKYRKWFLLGSAFVLGLYLSAFFSIIHFIQITLMQVSIRWQWVLVVGLTGLSFVFLGRFYCGWLCPYGALTEVFSSRHRWSPEQQKETFLRQWKYCLLLLILSGVVLGLSPSQVDFEPYLTVFSMKGNLFTWMIAALGVLFSYRLPRLWCRYLCPVGALSGLLCRRQRGYKGSETCPVGLKIYIPAECIRCNQCYTPEQFSPKQPHL